MMRGFSSVQFLALFIISAECQRVPPTELHAVHLSKTSVFLRWQWPSTKDSYKVTSGDFEVYAKTGDKEKKVGSVLGKAFFVLEGLRMGTDYEITVAHVSAEGVRFRSDELEVRTLDGEVLEPTDVRMSDHPQPLPFTETYSYETFWEFDLNNSLAQNLTGFEVIDCADDCSSNLATREQLSLGRGLTYYTNYTIVVSALFKDHDAVGKIITFKTSRGRPQEVENIDVYQKPDTLIMNITWSPPIRMYGLFKYYELIVYTPKDLYLVNETTTDTTFVFSISNETQVAQMYFIVISAYNTFDNGTSPEGGPPNSMTHHLDMPEPPKDLELKTCRPDSIGIEIKRESTEDLTFQYTYSGNPTKLTGSSNLFLSGFETYQEVDVSVSACLVLDGGYALCGDPRSKTFRTNVGPSSEIRNLELDVDGAEPILSWETPEEPAGPINGYVVLITDKTRNEINELVVPNATLEFHFDALRNCTKYELAVMAYNDDVVSGEKVNGRFNGTVLYTSPYCEVPAGAPSTPAWAIILIVVGVLGAAGGGGSYYLKTRRRSQGRPDDSLPTLEADEEEQIDDD